MSIPYVFRAIPDEFLTNDFLDDPMMMRLIRYIFKRVQYQAHEEIFTNNRTTIKILLQPFEFVYGRVKCAQECETSEDIIRNRMKKLLGNGFIMEIPSSSSSTFTVYTIVTKAFTVRPPAVRPAVIPSSYCPEDMPTNDKCKKHPQQISPAVRPAVPPQYRYQDTKMDIDQGYRPISEKKSKEHKHLNGEHVDYLKGLGYTTEIATQVIDAFNATKPKVLRSANGLIKTWAINTNAAHEAAVRFDGIRTDKYSVASCSRHIEFNGNGACQPIIIKYTEEKASEKIVDTAKRLGIQKSKQRETL